MNTFTKLEQTVVRGIMSLLHHTGEDVGMRMNHFAASTANIDVSGKEEDLVKDIINITFTCMAIAIGAGWRNFREYNRIDGMYDMILKRMREDNVNISPIAITNPPIHINVINEITRDFANISAMISTNGTEVHPCLHGFRMGLLASQNIDHKDDKKVAITNITRQVVSFATKRWGTKFATCTKIINDAQLALRFPDNTYHFDNDGNIIKPDGWQSPSFEKIL